ncbi:MULTISPECIES: hypothetical protein [unclassified Halomonas]|uniref:hypothetical protein n=1 Tax=unclassified Halomonas TaxID=2609666 RepID=UPI002886BB6B|nr:MULTISPECIES: hypothetical protein [unclassified Halomonas]MDT0501928.1 hypothetical protein [Halomonas sp. PAR7]MDT0510983.1 hypothetical protein [Halomonas sp. LES1]MDT0592500.1 hypothetical protein [Halomonas sp. PAR8]
MWDFLKKGLDSGQIITCVLAIIFITWFIKIPDKTVGEITLDAWNKSFGNDQVFYGTGWGFAFIFLILWIRAIQKIGKNAKLARAEMNIS